MLRKVVWTLRQRRYAAMAALLFVVALICVAAGTWQIARFNQSVRDNRALDANARQPAVPLTTALVPLVGEGPSPSADAVRYRSVTATGTYLAGDDDFVGNQTLNGVDGYYVLRPVRTDQGTLLVVRGFVAATDAGDPPRSVPAPPAGTVRITGRLQTASTSNDGAATLGNGELVSINPGEQSRRLGAAVYDAYLTLDAGQPGTSGVSVLPDPDLSNPAGGAYEWQHFAYIIQWYFFALVALVAPFLIARREVEEARREYLGIDPGREELGIESGDNPDRPRPEGGTVALRTPGTLARTGGATTEQWQRAARLADRYGRSLGADYRGPIEDEAPSDAVVADVDLEPTPRVPNIAVAPARSADSYQGSYNDYLWELSLADGDMPSVVLPPAKANGEPTSAD